MIKEFKLTNEQKCGNIFGWLRGMFMRKESYFIKICFILIVIVFASVTFFDLKSKNTENDKNNGNDNDNVGEVVTNDNKEEKLKKNKETVLYYRNKYNNNDVVGEFSILNTDYKKALMQNKKDNDYYLNHTENGNSSFMGSIYLDFRIDVDSDNKLIIYGHNSEYVDMPFKILEEYYSYDFYKEHQYIKIVTENKVRLYKVYAVLVETSDFSYMKVDFKDSDDWYEHISSFKSKSMYDTLEDVEKDDNILIMQTCSTHRNYKKYNKKFLLVVAKEIK